MRKCLDICDDWYFEGDSENIEAQKLEKRLENAAEYLQSVLDQLYGEGPIDRAKLEDDLDELSGYLGVEMKPGSLNLDRPKNTVGFIDMCEYNKIFQGFHE